MRIFRLHQETHSRRHQHPLQLQRPVLPDAPPQAQTRVYRGKVVLHVVRKNRDV